MWVISWGLRPWLSWGSCWMQGSCFARSPPCFCHLARGVASAILLAFWVVALSHPHWACQALGRQAFEDSCQPLKSEMSSWRALAWLAQVLAATVRHIEHARMVLVTCGWDLAAPRRWGSLHPQIVWDSQWGTCTFLEPLCSAHPRRHAEHARLPGAERLQLPGRHHQVPITVKTCWSCEACDKVQGEVRGGLWAQKH